MGFQGRGGFVWLALVVTETHPHPARPLKERARQTHPHSFP